MRDDNPSNQVESESESPIQKSNPSASEGSAFTSSGFFEALANGTLLGGHCLDCDTQLLPPRPACYNCGGWNIAIEEQPKTGTIQSYTRIHKSAPAFADLTPFPVAIVELDSGARLPGRVSADYDELEIGMSVKMNIEEPSEADLEFALSHEEEWPIHIFEVVKD